MPDPSDAVPDQPEPTTPDDGEQLGGLTVEDDPEGTVDPADLAGSADEDDADVS